MWLFLSQLAVAASSEAILVEDGDQLEVVLNTRDQWTVIYKIPKDPYISYEIESVLDIDGDGSKEISLLQYYAGTAMPWPALAVLKQHNGSYQLVDDANSPLGTGSWVRSGSRYVYRINTPIPGNYTDYLLNGMAFTVSSVSAPLPSVPSVVVPKWLISEYVFSVGYCRPMHFFIKETQIEYRFPELGVATISGISVTADSILITTNLPAPWTVLRLRKPEEMGIRVDWSASTTGTFENECVVDGGAIPGW